MTVPLAPNLPITPRELAVLQLVAQGFSNPEIAEALGTKTATVGKQVATAMQRLRARSRTHACSLLDDLHPGWRAPLDEVRRPENLAYRLRVIADEVEIIRSR